MAAGQQLDPPEMDHIAPNWFQGWVRKLLLWLVGIRPVAGVGIDLTDAPGGGTLISCNIKSVAKALGPPKISFWWYPSPHIGGGVIPANQGLKIRFREGYINADIVPTNMGSEFILVANKKNYVKVTAHIDPDGVTTSATIGIQQVPLIADVAGELNVAPATSARAIWVLTTDDKNVIGQVLCRIGSLDVTPRVYKMSCSGTYVRMFWGTTINLGFSDETGAII